MENYPTQPLPQEQVQNQNQAILRGAGAVTEIGTEAAAHGIGRVISDNNPAPQIPDGIPGVSEYLAEPAVEIAGAVAEGAAEASGSIIGAVCEFIGECIAGLFEGV